MSVGKGSIKRAAGAAEPKPAQEKKVVAAKEPVKKAPAKPAAKKKAPAKKATTKPAVKQTLPVSNSTAGKNYGVGDELPIFLM